MIHNRRSILTLKWKKTEDRQGRLPDLTVRRKHGCNENALPRCMKSNNKGVREVEGRKKQGSCGMKKDPLRPLSVRKGINANLFFVDFEAHHETSNQNGIINLGILKEKR